MKKTTRKSKGSSGAKPSRGMKTVARAIASGVVASSSKPKWQGAGNGVRIHHREFVTQLNHPGGGVLVFDPQTTALPGLDLNPCSTLFPWLGGVAQNFERYHFNSIRLTFVASQPSTTGGRAYAGIDLDYDDPVATSVAGIMTNPYAAEAPVWQEFSLVLAGSVLHRDQPWKFVNMVQRTNYVEPRTAYCGFLMFASNASAASVWDLVAEYDVTLDTPVLDEVILYTTLPASPMEVAPPAANRFAVTNSLPVTAAGGIWSRQVRDTGAQGALTSLVPMVCSGIGLCPILQSAVFSASSDPSIGSGKWAYDVSRLRSMGGGSIEWLHQHSITGAFPADGIMHPANACSMRLEAFDQAGTALAAYSPTRVFQSLSPRAQTGTMNQLSEWVIGRIGVSVADLFAMWPAVKYVVASLQTTGNFGAAAAGLTGGGVRYVK